MKWISIVILMAWPNVQNSDLFEQSIFTLSFEGIIDERNTYRLKETILGEVMLNPIIGEVRTENDSIFLKLTVLFEGNKRDGVKVFKLKRFNKLKWKYFSKNRYYIAEPLLGITENGNAEIKISHQQDLHLMFLDTDECLPITGLQLSQIH